MLYSSELRGHAYKLDMRAVDRGAWLADIGGSTTDVNPITSLRPALQLRRPSLSDTMQPVLIRMPSDLYDQLKQHAEGEDRTIAAEVRRAVRRYLEQPSA
jgi:hypothetical protein